MTMYGALLDYFYTTLKEEISFLETQRLEAYARVKSSRVYWALGAGLLFLVFVNTLFKEEHLFALFFALTLGGAGCMLHEKHLTRTFRGLFKEHLIGRMVEHLGLSYAPQGHVSPHMFRQAAFFARDFDTYGGDDLVKGNIAGVEVTWSDVKATYTTKNAKGKSTRHTLFEGLFFMAPFPRLFHKKTWVLPDVAQKILGDFGTLVQGLDRRGALVKLDNPNFERAFVVFSEDQIEARYLLSPVMMERLLALKNHAKTPLHVSFIAGHIFLGFSYGKPSFEPALSQPLGAFKTVEKHAQMLALMYGIVEALGLKSPHEAG